MANEPLSRDEVIGISTAVLSPINTLPLLSTLYTYFYCRSGNFPVPDREKFDNSGYLGTQAEGATKQRSGFVNPPVIEFSGDVDTGIFSVIARRMLGKADTVPAGGDIIAAGTIFKHHFALLGNRTAAGRQLPASGFVFQNGALDYLYNGVGNTLSMTQNGAEPPQYTANFLGTGMYKRTSDISGPAFGTPTVPTESNIDNTMDGAETEVEYTTTAQKWLARIDEASPQRLRSISATVVNNALDPNAKQAGAKRLDTTTPAKGWILSYLLHGDRTSQLTFRVGVPGTAGAAIDELQAALNDTIVTDFRWRMNGDFIGNVANPNERHRVELIYDKLYFRNVRRAPDAGAEYLDIDGFHVNTGTITDPDFVRMDLINGVATAIV